MYLLRDRFRGRFVRMRIAGVLSSLLWWSSSLVLSIDLGIDRQGRAQALAGQKEMRIGTDEMTIGPVPPWPFRRDLCVGGARAELPGSDGPKGVVWVDHRVMPDRSRIPGCQHLESPVSNDRSDS